MRSDIKPIHQEAQHQDHINYDMDLGYEAYIKQQNDHYPTLGRRNPQLKDNKSYGHHNCNNHPQHPHPHQFNRKQYQYARHNTNMDIQSHFIKVQESGILYDNKVLYIGT